MLTILPLASAFHSADQVRATVAGIAAALAARGTAHRMLAAPGAPAGALLIVTGGTEHLALRALEGQSGPALLLAHPSQNSLPAAMEVLSLLRQQGRPGRIILLNGEAGYAALARAADHLAVRDRLRATRLGRIGAPSDWLVGSTPDPRLVTRTWGPEVVDVPMEEVREAIRGADAREAAAIGRDFREGARGVLEPSPQDLELAARVAVGLRAVVKAHRLDACSVRCFDLVTELRTTGCLALSALLDEGVVAGCEGDLPAAVTMLWMQAVSGRPGFMANPQDLDPAAGTLWLAHCTIARGLVRGYTLRSHFESSLGVGLQGDLPEGPVTLARIGGADLGGLFVSDGELLANGDSGLRCRTQVQVRLTEDVGQLLSAPMGNHHVLAPGHWAEPLKEYHGFLMGSAVQAAGRCGAS